MLYFQMRKLICIFAGRKMSEGPFSGNVAQFIFQNKDLGPVKTNDVIS